MDSDPDWGWARGSIARLLSMGFEKGSGAIHISQRTKVWDILRTLTSDPDPTPEREIQYGGSNLDSATLSINTTRGEAMHAVIRYALWVRHNFDNLPNANELADRGFDEIPEVREVLDQHLDMSKDPSLAIRAVYGQWFPWLFKLDSKWTQERISNIFPINKDQRESYDAAWNTYVTFNRAYDDVLKVLRDQYVIAIDRLGLTREGRVRLNPDESLAEHLITFYWRGKLDFSDTYDVLKRFFNKASPELIGHALEYIGQSLYGTKETIPSHILERLKYLWNSRLEIAKASDTPDRYKAEMTSFGWWFVSGKFDDRWAIEQLIESLKIAAKSEPNHMVVERLAELVQKMPKETINCLDMIIKGDREGWNIFGWRLKARLILAEALKTDAASASEKIIHYLGSHGYLEFRDLLKRV